LSALLAQALITVEHEYARRSAEAANLPSLAVWSNVLRPVGDEIELRALPAAARLSKRAVRSAVGAAEKRGWLVTEGATVRLSPAAEAAREQWPTIEADVDAAFVGLDTRLRALVRQLYLEWPHYPTGYGPADHSITGGVYTLGGGRTDSTVPTHGADWVPVTRDDVDGSSVEGLSVSALLSQAFVGFAADFEELWLGGLHLAATVLRLLPDEGLPVTGLPMLSRLKGDGKSVLERHGFIEIRRNADDPKMRVAVPTARGRYTRDEYDPTVGRVEERWRKKYGVDVVDSLRAALESLDVDRSLPHSVIDTLT
jgi:hypothetical protein